MTDDENNQRISQTGNRKEEKIGSRLAEASFVAERVLESIQKIAGTTACKGVQIHALFKYAINHGWWFEDITKLGVFSDRGSENEVYMSYDGKTVYKLNDFRYADDNLTSFFERIKIHNIYFPECAYDLIGFAYNKSKNICALLSQPFIIAEREATMEEIVYSLESMGFVSCLNGEYFTNDEYDIFDALPNNVLMGIDGNLYFIDTIIYRNNDGNLNKYQSLSPYYSK